MLNCSFNSASYNYFFNDFILMPGTLRFLIEDSILFRKNVNLAKHLNHIVRWRWVADFNFDLIMRPPFCLTFTLRFVWFHDYEIVLFEFFLHWVCKNASHRGFGENLIDWKRLKSSVFEKFSVTWIKVPRGDWYCLTNRLRWNEVYFLLKLLVKFSNWRLVSEFLLGIFR